MKFTKGRVLVYIVLPVLGLGLWIRSRVDPPLTSGNSDLRRIAAASDEMEVLYEGITENGKQPVMAKWAPDRFNELAHAMRLTEPGFGCGCGLYGLRFRKRGKEVATLLYSPNGRIEYLSGSEKQFPKQWFVSPRCRARVNHFFDGLDLEGAKLAQ